VQEDPSALDPELARLRAKAGEQEAEIARLRDEAAERAVNLPSWELRRESFTAASWT
jgi:hypothetical protein